MRLFRKKEDPYENLIVVAVQQCPLPDRDGPLDGLASDALAPVFKGGLGGRTLTRFILWESDWEEVERELARRQVRPEGVVIRRDA